MSYLSRMNTRKYIKIFNKYVLPQSLETQSLSVAKWKPQITDLSLEIGWERDSWIPHIMPPGLRRYCLIVIKNILFHICSRPGLRRYCRIVIKNILFHICSRPGLRRYCLIVIKNILFHICSRPGLRRYCRIVNSYQEYFISYL